ncbi:isoaspartyl peptidase/L-asparaginase [Nitrosospira sp. Is2]|uniref:isoaspartyl peptidase/L-asparaginase n=1 Tax=Nitrosospira sp. Is2 TaxID=3080532 RepID=UPI0029551384|nr:isoaspartyl peptidase/L-asparaginase [Nitrosospira sp. Is2]WON74641.1 isoaspartyl peptidase/L-asparaginase [Nitrosospira sp. Is2]
MTGAGTYADNRSVAVSATGSGEMFIRTIRTCAAAFNTAAQIRLLNASINEAADNTLAEVAAIGGDWSLIVLDAKGNYAMRFNIRGMFHVTIGSDGVARVFFHVPTAREWQRKRAQ